MSEETPPSSGCIAGGPPSSSSPARLRIAMMSLFHPTRTAASLL
jgi:hypothetical protein